MEKTIRLNELHVNQQKVVDGHKRFSVLSCGRRWGKSALAINLLSEIALDGKLAGYFTPTYKLLDGTFNECLHALEPVISRKNDHQFIELITGVSILLGLPNGFATFLGAAFLVTFLVAFAIHHCHF